MATSSSNRVASLDTRLTSSVVTDAAGVTSLLLPGKQYLEEGFEPKGYPLRKAELTNPYPPIIQHTGAGVSVKNAISAYISGIETVVAPLFKKDPKKIANVPVPANAVSLSSILDVIKSELSRLAKYKATSDVVVFIPVSLGHLDIAENERENPGFGLAGLVAKYIEQSTNAFAVSVASHICGGAGKLASFAEGNEDIDMGKYSKAVTFEYKLAFDAFTESAGRENYTKVTLLFAFSNEDAHLRQTLTNVNFGGQSNSRNCYAIEVDGTALYDLFVLSTNFDTNLNQVASLTQETVAAVTEDVSAHAGRVATVFKHYTDAEMKVQVDDYLKSGVKFYDGISAVEYMLQDNTKPVIRLGQLKATLIDFAKNEVKLVPELLGACYDAFAYDRTHDLSSINGVTFTYEHAVEIAEEDIEGTLTPIKVIKNTYRHSSVKPVYF